MSILYFVGGVVCGGGLGRPRWAAPTGFPGRNSKAGGAGGGGAPPLRGKVEVRCGMGIGAAGERVFDVSRENAPERATGAARSGVWEGWELFIELGFAEEVAAEGVFIPLKVLGGSLIDFNLDICDLACDVHRIDLTLAV